MTVPTTILFTGIATIVAFASFLFGRQAEAKREGKEQGRMIQQLDTIVKEVESIKKHLEEINVAKIFAEIERIENMNNRNYKSLQRCHKRLDEHLRQEHKIVIAGGFEDEE